MKKIYYFLLLLFIVLITNYSIISFNMLYPEQPTIYLANQRITHLWDLINVYLHPAFLHPSIPFFRPSGHFLMYQLLTPLLGWHNNQAFMIVNFVFLSIAGYFLIRTYTLLFPPFQYGGLIAFAIYMMHPALSLSKFTIMHFEFAYVALCICSLYYFISFCQLKKIRYLFGSLIIYMIAVTFKEPALMLGPVLAVYYLISKYQHETLRQYCHNIISRQQTRLILLSLTALSLLLLMYILSSWPDLTYGSKTINLNRTLGTASAFLTDAFGLRQHYLSAGFIAFPKLSWRTIIFPESARWAVWLFLTATIWAGILLFRSSDFLYKKAFIFILIASLIFLVLPLGWGMAGPWHYSLTLLMLSLAMGFSVEYLCHCYDFSLKQTSQTCIALIIILCSITIQVDHLNIQKYLDLKDGPLVFALNRNAVFNPPELKSRLNNQSLLVVEDSLLHNDYLIGNAAFPFLLVVQQDDYDGIAADQKAYLMKFDYNYSGTLFRYAYQLPSLKEEVYPFTIEKMDDVPNEVIYRWIQQDDNIFAVGYDANGNWHDKTAQFKRMLAAIKQNRQLVYHSYQHYIEQKISNQYSYSKAILFPDNQLCAYTCDQDKQCIGFTLTDNVVLQHHMISCDFYRQKTGIKLADAKQSDVYVKERTMSQKFDAPYNIVPIKSPLI